MKAARLHGARDVRVEEVPTPQPGPGEILVRVRAVSICPSDCRLYADGHAAGLTPEHPLIQGHEFAGEVVALGPGVTAPVPGTRVAIDPSWHCGACDVCHEGLTHLCRQIIFPSFPPRDGALAEFIACPAHSAYPLPPNLEYIEGALTEPLGVAIHAVRLACLEAAERVIVLGAGTIGLCVTRLVRRAGCRQVAVVEPIPRRREAPATLGADPVVGSHLELLDRDWEAAVVFECSGDGEALEQALYLARPAGRVVVVGIPRPERVTLDLSVPRRRELTVVFSRRSRGTLPEAVALAASGEVDLSSLPTRQFSLEHTAQALEATIARPGNMLRAIVSP